MTEDLLIKYVAGVADEAEARSVREWINQNEDNRKEFFALKNVYALSQGAKRKLEIDKEFKALSGKMKLNPRRQDTPSFYVFLKYAAIIVFAVLLGNSIPRLNFLQKTDYSPVAYNEIVMPPGQISEIVLSEGTHVWLNSGTSIKFPTEFGKNSRDVFLTGEAYFEVSKNESKPFIVHSGDISTKVLGTEFNINAYNDSRSVETTLMEGSVEILDKSDKKVTQLKPGEQLVYFKDSKKATVARVDTDPYIAWKNGELVFRNSTLKELKPKLERWYNVDITFADPKVEEFKFSGTILKDKPFDQVLMAIKLTLPISYKIDTKLKEKNKIILYSLN